jgi:hypothetical protein
MTEFQTNQMINKYIKIYDNYSFSKDIPYNLTLYYGFLKDNNKIGGHFIDLNIHKENNKIL